MKLLFEEYSELILTIIGGLIIISIIVGVCLQTKIDTMHSENINKLNPILEKIKTFECKDILIESPDDDLLKDVVAYSNTGKDIKEYVFPRIIDKEEQKYVEYVLKYNNDFMVKRVKCYIKEEEENEDDV